MRRNAPPEVATERAEPANCQVSQTFHTRYARIISYLQKWHQSRRNSLEAEVSSTARMECTRLTHLQR